MIFPARMKKVTALVLERDRKRAISTLRDTGAVHLVNLSSKDKSLPSPDPEGWINEAKSLIFRIDRIMDTFSSVEKQKESVIQKLRKFLQRKAIEREQVQHRNPRENIHHAERIISMVEEDLYKITERLEKLRNIEGRELERLQSLEKMEGMGLDMSLLGEYRHLSIIVGEIPTESIESLRKKLPETVIIKVKDRGEVTTLVVAFSSSDTKPGEILREHHFIPIQIEGEGTPEELILEIKRKILMIEEERRSLTDKIERLSVRWDKKLNALHEVLELDREEGEAVLNFLHTRNTFIIQGYIPERRMPGFRRRIERDLGKRVFIRVEDPTEEAPVLLENPSLVRPFEFITKMYGTPRYNDLDPTFLIALAFPLFFGICLTDVGYGVLMLFLSLFLYRIYKESYQEGMKNLLKVFIICSIPTIILGFLTGSIFGNLAQKFFHFPVVFDLFKRAKIALILSILLGLVHVNLGIFLSARKKYRSKDIRGCMDELSYFVIEIAIILLFLGSNLGAIFLAGGLLIRLKLNSIFGIMDITGLFGNILSYARLFALAMATAAIALAVNKIAELLMGVFLGIIIVPLVLILGHLFSFMINLLGSFIHPLRLHYVEFFSKFHEGGGMNYDPFRVERRYTYVK